MSQAVIRCCHVGHLEIAGHPKLHRKPQVRTFCKHQTSCFFCQTTPCSDINDLQLCTGLPPRSLEVTQQSEVTMWHFCVLCGTSSWVMQNAQVFRGFMGMSLLNHFKQTDIRHTSSFIHLGPTRGSPWRGPPDPEVMLFALRSALSHKSRTPEFSVHVLCSVITRLFLYLTTQALDKLCVLKTAVSVVLFSS